MLDIVLGVAIAVLVAVVVVQEALSVKAARAYDKLKRERDKERVALAKATIEGIDGFIKSAEREMRRRVIKAIDDSVNEIIALEKRTGRSAAEVFQGGVTSKALDDWMLGTPVRDRPVFTKHDPLADALSKLTGSAAEVFAWSPGDPIPDGVPNEVKAMLREISSLDHDLRHGPIFTPKDGGSADPLADPTSNTGTGGLDGTDPAFAPKSEHRPTRARS
jgi:hypothetical protein